MQGGPGPVAPAAKEGEKAQDRAEDESEHDAADRQLHGRDASLSGEITLTLPDILAYFFLMPELVTLAERYPDIELKMLISYDIFDLARREADIALRVYVDKRQPPDDLIGRKLETVSSCYYASEEYLANHDPRAADSTARWIGWGDDEMFVGSDALACLATRIPYEESVTPEKLKLIDQFESILVKEGFRNVRARLKKDVTVPSSFCP